MENSSTVTIEEFIRYNNWANQQVLAACEPLSEEQLATTAVGTYGTIRDTLEHIISAEANYAGRLGITSPVPMFLWEDKPKVSDVAEYALQVGQALLQAVRIQPTEIVTEYWEAGTVKYQAIGLLIQIINHGIEHRTNITTILVQQNLTAPEVDGWGYLWSHAAQFEASEERNEKAG